MVKARSRFSCLPDVLFYHLDCIMSVSMVYLRSGMTRALWHEKFPLVNYRSVELQLNHSPPTPLYK